MGEKIIQAEVVRKAELSIWLSSLRNLLRGIIWTPSNVPTLPWGSTGGMSKLL